MRDLYFDAEVKNESVPITFTIFNSDNYDFGFGMIVTVEIFAN